MAKKTAKIDKKATRKAVKKSFYAVKVPLTATNISLLGSAQEDFVGRVVKLDLTRSLKGKSFELRFKIRLVDRKSAVLSAGKSIEGIGGKDLIGEPISMNLVTSHVRKVMRRGSDYVEDSFDVEMKDGTVRIKPLLITRRRVSRAVRRALRDLAKKHLLAYLKARKIEEGFSEIMSNKVQKDLSAKLRKIYPLALCEIRRFEVLSMY
jgi:ribosomal protein S3AE